MLRRHRQALAAISNYIGPNCDMQSLAADSEVLFKQLSQIAAAGIRAVGSTHDASADEDSPLSEGALNAISYALHNAMNVVMSFNKFPSLSPGKFVGTRVAKGVPQCTQVA